eukprot:Pgem_evm1s17865
MDYCYELNFSSSTCSTPATDSSKTFSTQSNSKEEFDFMCTTLIETCVNQSYYYFDNSAGTCINEIEQCTVEYGLLANFSKTDNNGLGGCRNIEADCTAIIYQYFDSSTYNCYINYTEASEFCSNSKEQWSNISNSCIAESSSTDSRVAIIIGSVGAVIVIICFLTGAWYYR